MSDIGKKVAKIVRDAIGGLNHTHIGYSSEHDYLADPYVDDIMELIHQHTLDARIDEVERCRDAWHGTDDDGFADAMNERHVNLESQKKNTSSKGDE